jgi:hypothetical protein
VELCGCYKNLKVVLNKFKNSEFKMKQGFKAIFNVDFKNDIAELKDYLTKKIN